MTGVWRAPIVLRTVLVVLGGFMVVLGLLSLVSWSGIGSGIGGAVLIVGGACVALSFGRSRLTLHPDAIVARGAIRTVVIPRHAVLDTRDTYLAAHHLSPVTGDADPPTRVQRPDGTWAWVNAPSRTYRQPAD